MATNDSNIAQQLQDTRQVLVDATTKLQANQQTMSTMMTQIQSLNQRVTALEEENADGNDEGARKLHL
jgi:vacuolar-type H+-ATPase subunit D/Vma8